uniref:Uncharacterized protein n=1 Tax=Romanomermis culicivorax TaxID=13658 RepID=A0A915KXV6_ROMCU
MAKPAPAGVRKAKFSSWQPALVLRSYYTTDWRNSTQTMGHTCLFRRNGMQSTERNVTERNGTEISVLFGSVGACHRLFSAKSH